MKSSQAFCSVDTEYNSDVSDSLSPKSVFKTSEIYIASMRLFFRERFIKVNWTDTPFH
jgi:hypothetical protein